VRTTVFLAGLVAAGVVAASATGAQPTITKGFTFEDVATLNVCGFPIEVTFSQVGTEIDYFDSSGTLTRVYLHTVEHDVFRAHGKTLSGLPFTFNVEVLFDGEDVTHVYASGVASRIILPGGSLFLSAGRADFVDHPGESFLLSPDVGAKGNVAGFCAALS
jgi:hypothetical protein